MADIDSIQRKVNEQDKRIATLEKTVNQLKEEWNKFIKKLEREARKNKY